MVVALAREEARSITILGSTGSVGCNTVDLVGRNRDRFRVEALTAHRNVDRLAEQALRLRPRLAVIADRPATPTLPNAWPGPASTWRPAPVPWSTRRRCRPSW